ncbi:uncharacterized protein T551_03116 [Pneumocystis jirovecii RU7]|uniref:Golgi apparatus membrane protein tvp15 n=1 Tax=Pneumocystis jirovecii (strain RU7) TaxID=1408657 RepID=A0A0W4ZFJ9_PNEJ7|nr:uncharacterized protein T551_03116 [Pneumocystis jirovecii RU7]KTW27122.1 hypothetical protein T551_03116 [Pneumocystis jirovecii RU7]
MFESGSIFKIVNILTAIIMILGGISQFFPLGFKNIIIGIYVIMFGIFTAILEFFIPPETAKYCSFFFSFLGRGIFYIFVGSLLLDNSALRILSGAIIIIIGIIYFILEFASNVVPPDNMREPTVEDRGHI